MLQCIWGASFFVLEETRVSLGAFVFLRQALSFFKIAIFRFPDYISCSMVLHALPISTPSTEIEL